jgi:hypothetical protein
MQMCGSRQTFNFERNIQKEFSIRKKCGKKRQNLKLSKPIYKADPMLGETFPFGEILTKETTLF